MTLGEAAKVASGTVDALKSQPLALALIVINILFLAIVLWFFMESAKVVTADHQERTQMVEKLMTTCGERILEQINELRLEIRGIKSAVKP